MAIGPSFTWSVYPIDPLIDPRPAKVPFYRRADCHTYDVPEERELTSKLKAILDSLLTLYRVDPLAVKHTKSKGEYTCMWKKGILPENNEGEVCAAIEVKNQCEMVDFCMWINSGGPFPS